MAVFRVIATVTGVALFGMLLGTAFGWAAAKVAPSLFMSLVPSKDIEPVGFATVLGAFSGVLCGGTLGAFAVILDAITSAGRRPASAGRRGSGDGAAALPHPPP